MFPKIKKHVAVIVISGLLLFNFTPLLTPTAQADLTGGTWATATASWAHFAKFVLKEFILDLAARLIARSQLSGALKGIANQVIQSGRTGRTPAFVQNWRNLLTDAEYRGEDVFRAVLGNTVQCPYFRNEILRTFGADRIQPLPSTTQNFRVNNLDPFALRGRCTMPQAWSIANYQRDFTGNGGWDALVRLSKPQNNFYGSLLMSLKELDAQRGLERGADLAEASPEGFTGVRKSQITGSSCDTPPTTKAICEDCTQTGRAWCLSGGGPLANTCVAIGDPNCTYSTSFPSGCSAIPSTVVNSQARCTFLGNVSTPSKILGEGASEFIDSNLKWLTTSDEISEVLGNFIQSMINKLANYASDTIAGDARDPKVDTYNACIRGCNNLSSGSQYAQCIDRCTRQVPGNDLPPTYDDFDTGGPTPTPVPPTPTPPAPTPTPPAGAVVYTINIQDSEGEFMTAEGGGGQSASSIPPPVTSNRSSAGALEVFRLWDFNGGTLTSGDQVSIVTPNNTHFFRAEGGGGSTLDTGAVSEGVWETFVIEKQNGTGGIANGDQVSFQTWNNSNYLSDRQDLTDDEVNARPNAIGPWETFTIIIQ